MNMAITWSGGHRACVSAFATTFILTSCGMGQQFAAGPVVGYVADRGVSVGWEAGGGPMKTPESGADPVPSLGSLITRFSAGMSWRPGAPGGESTERLSYLVWEPWLLVGGTFGAAHSSADGNLHALMGVWEAAPYVFGAPQRSFPLYACSPCYTISLAIGWRWSGNREFYLSPKLGILNDTKMPYPFQSYPD